MSRSITCACVLSVAYITGVLIQTPLEIKQALYDAIQAEYAHTLKLKTAENKRLELRIRELELLADKLN